MPDWLTMPLGEVADVRLGRQRSPKHETGEHLVPYLRAANVQQGYIKTDDVRLMNFTPSEQDSFRLQVGDVLLQEGGTPPGTCAVWNGDVPGIVCFQNTVLRLRARQDVVAPGYLWNLASWLHQSGQFAAVSRGTNNIKHLGATRAAELRVPVPPLEVQRRIIDLIEHIDDTRRAALCVEQAHRTTSPALTDAIFARGDCAVVELSEVAEGGIQIGPFGSQLHASDYTDHPAGVPVVMPRDIVDGRITTGSIKRTTQAHADRLSQHRLVPGDIVLPRRGDLTKRAMVTDDQAGWLCGTGCIRIRVAVGHDAAVIFESLSRAETQRWINDNSVGATMKNLNSKIVGRIPLAIPTDEVGVARLFECSRTAVEASRRLAESAAATRRSVLSALLGAEHAIPESYDRFLEQAEASVEGAA